MKDKVVQAFNKLSVSYEHEVDQKNLYNTEYERPAMVELLPADLVDLKVLDAGCAAGWYTDYLLKNGAIPTGIDISPRMVEATRRRTHNQVNVLCTDISEPLPFSNQTFDVIVSSLALHYVRDWELTFAEFARILKPGGLFLYSVHHPMMDIDISQAKSYFNTEPLCDYWNRGEELVEVNFYRRPLQQIINTTLQHFQLDSITEPIPTAKFKQHKPESYKRLLERPNFLIVRAKNWE